MPGCDPAIGAKLLLRVEQYIGRGRQIFVDRIDSDNGGCTQLLEARIVQYSRVGRKLGRAAQPFNQSRRPLSIVNSGGYDVLLAKPRIDQVAGVPVQQRVSGERNDVGELAFGTGVTRIPMATWRRSMPCHARSSNEIRGRLPRCRPARTRCGSWRRCQP